MLGDKLVFSGWWCGSGDISGISSMTITKRFTRSYLLQIYNKNTTIERRVCHVGWQLTQEKKTTIQATARHDRRENLKDLDNVFRSGLTVQIRLRIRSKKGRATSVGSTVCQQNLNIFGCFTAYFPSFTDKPPRFAETLFCHGYVMCRFAPYLERIECFYETSFTQ